MSDTADPTWWLIAAVLFAALLIAWALASIPVAALVCLAITRLKNARANKAADDEWAALLAIYDITPAEMRARYRTHLEQQ